MSEEDQENEELGQKTQESQENSPEAEAQTDAKEAFAEGDGKPPSFEDAEAAPAKEEPLTPEQEIAKWKDAALRSRADLDNYRKRIAREQEDSRRWANASLLGGLLPITDNFQMGLEAARAEDENSMLYQGMAMVARQIDDFLTAEGAEEIEAPCGADFDPNLHEAVSQEPSNEVEEGKVMRVLRRGYVLRGRLLRPANVVVSAGNAQPREGDEDSLPTDS